MTLPSLWQDRHRSDPAAPVQPATVDGRYDVAVVGAGLTGLTTALLLGRAGLTVVLLEAGELGDGTTGRTTAKVSLLQGTQLSTIRSRHAQSVVDDYVEAQREGAAWLRRFCDDHGVAVQDRDAVTFAHSADGEQSIRDELDVATKAGLPVEWADELPLPFPVRGAVRLPGQFQLDPVELLAALRQQAEAHGVRLVEHARVTKVRGSDPIRVTTTAGEVEANRVVVATNLPVLDRGGFFARMKPARSYIVAFQTQPRRWTPCTSPRTTRPVRSATPRLRTGTCCWSAATATPPAGADRPSRASTACESGPTSTGRTPSRRTRGRPRTTSPTTRCPSPARSSPATTRSSSPAATRSGA